MHRSRGCSIGFVVAFLTLGLLVVDRCSTISLKRARVILPLLISFVFFSRAYGFAQVLDKSALTTDAALSISNGFFDVFVEDMQGKGVGLFTVRTGKQHPATQKTGSPLNVLFGGAEGRSGTSFMTVRSYTTQTDYVQSVSGEKSSAFSVHSFNSFGLMTGSKIIKVGDVPVGESVKVTYLLPGPPITPDALEIVQELIVVGTTLSDSFVHVTTTITNKGTSPVALGIRYLWDLQMGEDDGPTIQPLNPDGLIFGREVSFLHPAFEKYAVRNNSFNASSSPLFDLLGTVTGPKILPDFPTSPTLLSYGSWPLAAETAFDYHVDSPLDVATTHAPQGEIQWGDSAILYYFGHVPEEAIQLPPGKSTRLVAALDPLLEIIGIIIIACILFCDDSSDPPLPPPPPPPPPPPVPDFSLDVAPSSQTAVQGQTVNYTITGTFRGESEEPVFLSQIAAAPTGAIVDISPSFISPGQTAATLSVTTFFTPTGQTPSGQYTLNVQGTAVGVIRETGPFILNLSPAVPADTPDISTASIPLEERLSPPPASDHQFVTTNGADLDRYRSRSEGISFDVDVTRAITEGVDPSSGFIIDPNTLVANGVVSAMATLRLAAFDVDALIDQGLANAGMRPEIDQVFVNGFPVGVLTGVNNHWAETIINVPIQFIRFPLPCNLETVLNCERDAARISLGRPIPRRNIITIVIDQGNISPPASLIGFYETDEFWRVAVDWASLSFQAMSPTVFIHGLHDDGGRGNAFMTSFGNHRLLFDNSINLPGGLIGGADESILCNARRLAGLMLLSGSPAYQDSLNSGCQDIVAPISSPTRIPVSIPLIASRFGVQGVHLVAHSKGGMDAREYIARYAQRGEILSLTTIGTPHKGSVLADLDIAIYNTALLRLTEPEPRNLKGLIEEFLGGIDDGIRGLTLNAVSDFNSRNLPLLQSYRRIPYFAISADADQNGDSHLTSHDELDGMLFEHENLEPGPLLDFREAVENFLIATGRGDIDIIYRILGGTQAIEIREEEYCITLICDKRFLGFIRVGGFRKGPVGVAIPSPAFQPNDGAVTVDSAKDSDLFLNLMNFRGANGRNHSTLMRQPVAELLIPPLQLLENIIGDFQ